MALGGHALHKLSMSYSIFKFEIKIYSKQDHICPLTFSLDRLRHPNLHLLCDFSVTNAKGI